MELKNSGCIETYSESGGKLNKRVKAHIALHEVYGDRMPDQPIAAVLNELQTYVIQVAEAKGFRDLTAGSLANVRGLWFELLLTVRLWNARLQRGSAPFLLVKFPNVRIYDFQDLFDPVTRSMLKDLRQSLEGQGLTITPTNPDFLLLEQRFWLEDRWYRPLTLSAEDLSWVQDAQRFADVEGKCDWDSVIAGLSLKTSLRPDRRLILVHEGNHFKALFAHLRSRHWKQEIRFRYYGAAVEEVSGADREALKTVAFHSMVDINAVKERAVDDVFGLTHFADIDKMMSQILATYENDRHQVRTRSY